MARTLLRIEEVALAVGVSVQTINNWYAFKRQSPKNELAKMLPNYVQLGTRQQRLWDKADIQALIRFKNSMPKGCKGVMGGITQRYLHKEN